MTRKVFTLLLALLLALTAIPSFTASAESDLPFVTLDWYTNQSEMPDCEMVNDAVNEYLLDKINANVNIHYWGSEYADKISTMILSGMDTGITCMGGNIKFIVQAQNGALYPLEDMLDTIAPGVKALFSDEQWNCVTFDNHIYMIPTLADNGFYISLIYNAEMLDELGLNIDDYTLRNSRDLEELGYKVKELRDANEKYAEFKDYPVYGGVGNIYPYAFALETFMSYTYYAVCNIDGINDIAGIDCDTVFDFYETPEFLEYCLQNQRMVEDGIYDYDYTNKDERNYTGGIFGQLGWGYVYIPEHLYGDAYTTKMKLFEHTWTGTTNYHGGTAISAHCAEPERAMMVLNLVNTDSEFATMMRFGIEDVHYTYDDEGKMTFEGTKNADKNNRAYYYWYGSSIGNLTIVNAPEELTGPDNIMLKRLVEYNKTCTTANHMGFIVDTDPISNEIAACTNVVSQYQSELCNGQASSQEEVEQLVDEFIAKLKANGVDTIVTEIQSQIDTWNAAK